MQVEVIVALLTLVGTVASGIISALISSGVTKYRLEQLEKKVDKHNNIIERTFKIEEHDAVVDEKIKEIERRLEEYGGN